MVTQKVIKEIYKKYNKPPKRAEDLSIPYFLDLLKEHHDLHCEEDEIVNRKADEGNLFARMLISRLHVILEFDKYVAFVFGNHIIFFDKHTDNMHIHFKPEKQGFFSRLFGKNSE